MSDAPPDRPLSVPILTAGSLAHPAVLAPLGVAVVPTAPLLLAWLDGEAGVLPLVILGLVWATCLGAALVAGVVVHGRRRWVEVTMEGFVLHSPRGRRTIRDEEVRALLLDDRLPNHTRAVLTVGAGPHSMLAFAYRHPDADGDPLAGLWKRLLRAMARRARDRLDQPHALEGEGWEVGQGRLVVRDGRSIDLSRVRQARTFEGRVWLGLGSEEGALRFPVRGRNARVLVALVRLLRSEAGPPAGEGPDGPLGPLVCEREGLAPSHPEADGRPAGVALGALLVLLPPMLCYLAEVRAGALLWLAVAVCGLGVILLLGQARAVRRLLRRQEPSYLAIHRDGIVLDSNGRRVALADGDIGGLTWGRPLVFTPAPGVDAPAIRFDGDLGDYELRLLGGRIARQRAEQRVSELRAGQAVPWTEDLRFLPEGLEYRWRTRLERGPPRVVTYPSVHYHLEGGTLLLCTRAGDRVLCRVRTDAPDFLIGLALFDLVQQGGLG